MDDADWEIMVDVNYVRHSISTPPSEILYNSGLLENRKQQTWLRKKFPYFELLFAVILFRYLTRNNGQTMFSFKQKLRINDDGLFIIFVKQKLEFKSKNYFVTNESKFNHRSNKHREPLLLFLNVLDLQFGTIFRKSKEQFCLEL